MSSNESRLPLLDWLRGLAAQVIVWHHLAFYGPLSDHARAVAGGPIDWLDAYGRLAVSIFFVIGGYLSARSMASRPPQTLGAVGRLVLRRYMRIAAPYLATLLIVLVANEIARGLMQHPSISAPPTVGQVLAHVLLLHNIFGYEALTAGIWYLAIDLQLVVLVALVHWLAGRLAGKHNGAAGARIALALLAVTSLMVWNRQPAMDRFAIYFLGTYVFGMFVAWVQLGLMRPAWFVAYLAAGGLAIAVEPRSRLLLATGVALVLMFALRGTEKRARSGSRLDRLARWLGDVSLCLFLVHFPVCLVVNAWWSRHLPPTPWLSLLGMAVAYSASLVCAHAMNVLITALERSRRVALPTGDGLQPTKPRCAHDVTVPVGRPEHAAERHTTAELMSGDTGPMQLA